MNFAVLTLGLLAVAPKGSAVSEQQRHALIEEGVKQHGDGQRARLERGIAQVTALWRPSDGDLAAFVRAQFIADPKQLDETFARYESILEQLDGHFLEIGRSLKWATEVDVGALLPVDPLMSAFSPSAHLTDDLFDSKLAFVVLLNWPQTTLAERLEKGASWSRDEWARVRLVQRFALRIPADVQQKQAEVGAAADLYIAQYNIWMHHLLAEKGERLFPKGLRLISHWNLRDELKADYAEPNGIAKQRLILQLMSRIVSQSIPKAVIDNPRLDWNPFTNAVARTPAEEVEATEGHPDAPASAPEPDVRYARLLAQFQAARAADPYAPAAPNAIQRSFDLGRELPEARVVAMLSEILDSPLVPKVAAEIQRRLGRPLEPQDLWFNGFQARGKFSESELDAITRKRYPTADAFAKDIPNILAKLGFPADKARFVSSHIVVDPSRGAGHAMPASRRGDFPHLRTRVEKDGMNYKGYNIAVHELGHNVEQVFSLYEVDHTLLAGVPNTAFTEALAFVFQARDLELLGLSKPDAESERLRVLNDFWQAWEIAGVALVDVAAWHWMYEHPKATPAQLREAVMQIARAEWNRHYAPVLGGKDSLLLGIYSHMIAYPIYLCDYPIGHMIAFQIEEHLRDHGPLGVEFERMAKFGSVTPDLWMTHATGAPVGPGPLLRATERALATAH